MQNNQATPINDEFNIIEIFYRLLEQKLLIFLLTSFITLIAFNYSSNIAETYHITALVNKPDILSKVELNRFEDPKDTEVIYGDFLTKLNSKEFQKKIFFENGFYKEINDENNIDNLSFDSLPVINLISTHKVEKSILTEKSFSLPFELRINTVYEHQVDLYTRFVNKLIFLANSETVDLDKESLKLHLFNRLELLSEEFDSLLTKTKNDRLSQIERIKEEDSQKIRVINDQIDALRLKAKLDRLNQIERIKEEDSQKIRVINDQIDALRLKAKLDRLNQIERIKEEDSQKIRVINDQIDALRLKAKLDRLNQIERIKEEDSQKIRVINDQIDRVRFRAKETRLNEIVILTDSAKLARSLGIIENNFKLISDDGIDSNLTIAIGENQELPQWYLYGEKALVERIELLENRTSDDPFTPELVTLKNQLKEVQLNNTLKTLEARQDDDPFIPELVILKNQLKEVQLNNTLKTLEARQDDDPFIPELVILKNQLKEVQLNNTLKTLEARQDDDPFIPELVILKNQLKEVQLNNTLKTLEERQDDSPFIARINDLKNEENNIKSEILKINEMQYDAMQLDQSAAFSQQKSTRSTLITFMGFLAGLILSVLIALIRFSAIKYNKSS